MRDPDIKRWRDTLRDALDAHHGIFQRSYEPQSTDRGRPAHARYHDHVEHVSREARVAPFRYCASEDGAVDSTAGRHDVRLRAHPHFHCTLERPHAPTI